RDEGHHPVHPLERQQGRRPVPALQRGLARMGLLRARLLTTTVALLAAACGVTLFAVTRLSRADETPGPPAGPVAVRFVEPGSTTLLQGPTRITVEAATAPDARIVSVTLYADDALLTVLEHAPYTVTWDAGRGAGVRRLRAVALDSAGRSGEAELAVRRVQV